MNGLHSLFWGRGGCSVCLKMTWSQVYSYKCRCECTQNALQYVWDLFTQTPQRHSQWPQWSGHWRGQEVRSVNDNVGHNEKLTKQVTSSETTRWCLKKWITMFDSLYCKKIAIRPSSPLSSTYLCSYKFCYAKNKHLYFLINAFTLLCFPWSYQMIYFLCELWVRGSELFTFDGITDW